MSEAPSILTKKIIFKKFILGKLLNTSDFGWVYEGKNLIKNIPVSIKIELTGKYDLLESEAYILMDLKGFGIPEIISFGKHGPFKILIEELLGKDLETLWESCPFQKDPLGKKKTYLKDICLLAIQGIERLKYIHNKNVIHRDIKTKNFLIGRKDPNVIYLIDFGFAKKYRSSRTGKHIRFSRLKYLIGSLSYASINAIKGYESSRRDDLESFGYMLIYLAKGGQTPWMKYDNLKDINEAMKKIAKMKLAVTDELLCKGLPDEFIQYMKYVKKLDFEQQPDYQYLIGLFTSLLSKNEMKKNITFFWIKPNCQKKGKIIFEAIDNEKKISLSKMISKNNSRGNSIKRLYNKIKESLSRNSVEKNNPNKYYSQNKNFTENNEKNKNLLNLRINTTGNNLDIKAFSKKINDRETTENVTSNPIKNKAHSNLFQTPGIQRIKTNTKKNLINSDKSMFQNYNFNKRKRNSLIKGLNFTLTNNKNISLYNNIYFIKGNSNATKQNTTNNSRLNITNNKKNVIYSYNSINNLNLKRNIIYKPKFKKNLIIKIA